MVRRETADLSPDFVFESKGRLTDYGYEVEVRIPFKSLRFQPAQEQSWGINVDPPGAALGRRGLLGAGQAGERVVPGAVGPPGRPDRAASRAGARVQSVGHRRGPPARRGADGWDYAGGSPELGGSVRWGVTNNLTLNGTANPDFSQVESDAGQFLFDPRNELFFSGEAAVLPRRHRAVHHAQQR